MYTNSLVSTCFARLPIPGTYANVFFGRIKNLQMYLNINQFYNLLIDLILVIKIKTVVFLYINYIGYINIRYNISNTTRFI